MPPDPFPPSRHVICERSLTSTSFVRVGGVVVIEVAGVKLAISVASVRVQISTSQKCDELHVSLFNEVPTGTMTIKGTSPNKTDNDGTESTREVWNEWI